MVLEEERDVLKVFDSSSHKPKTASELPDNFIEIQLNDETCGADNKRLSSLSVADISAVNQGTSEDKKEAETPDSQELESGGAAANTSVPCASESCDLSSKKTKCTEITSPCIGDQHPGEAPDVHPPAVLSLKEVDVVNTQHFVEAKEILHLSKVKSLYPELPLPVFDHTRDVATIKPLVPNEKLYPELPHQHKPIPFPREQLKIFEPCSWIENVDSFTEEFERIAHQDRHEFHELLMNYGRCRKQLLLAEAKLQIMISDWKNIKSKVWDFKEEHMTVQVININLECLKFKGALNVENNDTCK